MTSLSLLLASLLSSTQPTTPPDDPLAPLKEPHEIEQPRPAPPRPVTRAPVVISPVTPAPAPAPIVVVVPRDWPGVFAAIRAGQWTAASAGIAALPASPLTPLARAELFTARGSPPVTAEQVASLLAQAPELPQAEQLQRLALSRGALSVPAVPRRAALVPIGTTPRRGRAQAITGEPEADKLRLALEPLVKVDDALGAEALLSERGALLSYEARAELGQRVAWIYYVLGQDAQARRVADTWRQGATGDWALQSEWVSGLASWRMNDCAAASRAFGEVGRRSAEPSLAAAGFYWAARAEMACRRPAAVEPLMRAAARGQETFYGLLARRTLGMNTVLAPLDPGAASRIANLPNLVRAEALVRAGERDMAGELLRHQARIGAPADQPALVAEARKLELAATQHFLGHFGQPGARVQPAARYPRPSWAPNGGWQIDPALGLAHALQESSFRAEAVSQAGAVGLMQVLPTTRDLIARNRGLATGNLKDPAVNMAFGQEWIRWMRGHSATAGQLPKIIASYNAGPLPVGRWAVNDRGDPLLWIESMPYWETRYYVPSVLRNLWVYQGFDRAPTPTLTELAQHRWPSFPDRR